MDGRARQIDFGFARIGERVNGLPMQVAGIQVVGIDQPQVSHSGARQVLKHRTAEATQAYDQHAGALERRLARSADFLEQQLP
jgi:hypothetical protein